MKKILKMLLFIIMFACTMKIKAVELNYSEWSDLYPSGLDEVFIESEVRYKWYRTVDNLIEYTDEYYKEHDGYIKDEVTKKTFYRYITNKILYFNTENEIVEYDYCKKNFCYMKKFFTPTMVDLSEKEEPSDYENKIIYEISSEVSPMTGDAVVYSFIVFGLSLLTILVIMFKKRRKLSNE